MLGLASNPAAVPAATLLASFLMVLSAIGKKRLSWRAVDCRVCGHPRPSCTCRWL